MSLAEISNDTYAVIAVPGAVVVAVAAAWAYHVRSRKKGPKVGP